MSPLVSIGIILAVMIMIVSLKLNLNYSILAGIILTTLFFNRGFNVFGDLISTLTNLTNLNIIAMFILIFFLARLMDEAGILKKMLYSTEKVIRNTGIVVLSIPFLIGWVPSPSGAILSAPFVKEIGEKAKISKLRQQLINYWFRHISEYINPIYPGPILASSILSITFASFVYTNILVMAAVFLIGVLFFVRGIKQRELEEKKHSKRDFWNILNVVIPILIALILPTFFKINLSISLLAALIFTIIMNRIFSKKLITTLRKSIKVDIIILIILVLLFKTVLENSKAIELVAKSFIALNFPSLILIILVPMIISFLTGLTLAYVGIGFPLLMPFFTANGSLDLGLVMLAYEAGYFGLMMSPMHLCLSVTQKYFCLELSQIFKKLIVPQLLILGITLLLYFVGWPL